MQKQLAHNLYKHQYCFGFKITPCPDGNLL